MNTRELKKNLTAKYPHLTFSVRKGGAYRDVDFTITSNAPTFQQDLEINNYIESLLVTEDFFYRSTEEEKRYENTF